MTNGCMSHGNKIVAWLGHDKSLHRRFGLRMAKRRKKGKLNCWFCLQYCLKTCSNKTLFFTDAGASVRCYCDESLMAKETIIVCGNRQNCCRCKCNADALLMRAMRMLVCWYCQCKSCLVHIDTRLMQHADANADLQCHTGGMLADAVITLSVSISYQDYHINNVLKSESINKANKIKWINNTCLSDLHVREKTLLDCQRNNRRLDMYPVTRKYQ